MPEAVSTPAILAVFYLTFLSQIGLLSLYYPGKLARRIAYVLDNFPPEQYPKLYPVSSAGQSGEARRKLHLYRVVNRGIAAIGVAILAAMAFTGYRPDPLGGDEVFVMMYFALQLAPLVYLSIKEYAHYRLMRQAFRSTRRTAELRPRRLFDFIAPGYLAAAVLLYLAWLVFYLSGRLVGSWEFEVYASLALITGINLAYAGIVFRFISGRKLDPYKANADQLKQIAAIVKVLVFSSILISLLLMLTQAVDQYGLEVFDPPLTSLYIQFCVIVGVGVSLRTEPIETIDFEVYRGNATRPAHSIPEH